MISNRDDSQQSITAKFCQNPNASKKKVTKDSQTNLYEIHHIQTYNNIHRPKLSQLEREVIEDKLLIENIAQVNKNKRIKNGMPFVKFFENQFSNLENPKSNELNLKYTYKDFTSNQNDRFQEKEEHKDILEAIRTLKDNQFKYDFHAMMKKVQEVQHLSRCINQSAHNLNYSFSKNQKSKVQTQQKNPEKSFEEILEIEDQNFYEKVRSNINIFDYVFKNDHILSSKQILDQNYFVFNSMAEKIQKIKFPIFRDLSRFGRALISNGRLGRQTRLDSISSYEMSFKIHDIKYVDLLSISSGRFTPQIVYKNLYEGGEGQDRSPSSSLLQAPDAIYKDNQNLCTMNFANSNQQIDEIKDYLKLENNSVEKNYEKKYNNVKINIEVLMQQQRKLYSKTVADHKLHEQINTKVEDNLRFLLDIDKKQKIAMDRTISMNKTSKNRSEHLKIKKLLSSIKLKNDNEELIRDLVKRAI